MKSDSQEGPRRRKPSPLARAIGRRIRELREERGWAPRHLAALVGVRREQIEQYELGTALPTLRTLISFSQALRVSLDSLVLAESQAQHQLEDEELLRRFRAVGMLPWEARRAATELLDIVLGLHAVLHSSRRTPASMPRPRDPAAAELRLKRLAGLEREATAAFLEVVAGLRSFTTARKHGTGRQRSGDGESDGSR
jgi:transcriptional regulator with XRE-family HTH domain